MKNLGVLLMMAAVFVASENPEGIRKTFFFFICNFKFTIRGVN